jgi:ribokinase
MVGRVGRDAFGRELTAGLRADGVWTRHVHTAEVPTGAALIEVDAHGENTIAVASGANAAVVEGDVPAGMIGSADVVVAQLEVPLEVVSTAFRLARAAGVHTLLNAAPAQSVPASLLALCDAVVVNEHELAALGGHPAASDPQHGVASDAERSVASGPARHVASDAERSAASLLGRGVASDEVEAARAVRCAPDQAIVVTLGARGALAVLGDEVVHQPSFAVEVVDTVGAGDAFVGGFVVGRWWSDGLGRALRLGCAAGALATTRRGAQPSLPTRAEVEALLARAEAPR